MSLLAPLRWLLARPRPPRRYVTGPNGERTRLTWRHATVLAPDGELWCDRCRNGRRLACMDLCSCGRWG